MSTRFVSPRRYATVPEAAEYLGVSEKTCRRMISAGELPAYRIRKKLLRIDLNDIDAILRPIPTAKVGRSVR